MESKNKMSGSPASVTECPQLPNLPEDTTHSSQERHRHPVSWPPAWFPWEGWDMKPSSLCYIELTLRPWSLTPQSWEGATDTGKS